MVYLVSEMSISDELSTIYSNLDLLLNDWSIQMWTLKLTKSATTVYIIAAEGQSSCGYQVMS